MRIVYNSFDGRYADNPQAIYAALLAADTGDDHLWLADPQRHEAFPPEVPTVPIRSAAAVAALESADLVIANCHVLQDSWTKPAGAFYLQTWHGTPLKRIHRSAVNAIPSPVMDELDFDIGRWDALVTPSAAGSELLRNAFGYRGDVWETGYPRNDVLLGPDRALTRERMRRQLGIAASSTVVLFAPTYRDDQVAEHGVPLGFDPNTLVEALGEDHVLLVRRHYYLTRHTRIDSSDRIRDVTGHPEISDLYLAADALVTDYSSALFDFAVTGKPILLYPYDLEDYRDRVRGFTFDLEAEVPGPVLRTQDELTAAVLDLPAVSATTADRYARFRDRYCHLEDGRATERTLARLDLIRAGPGRVAR